MTKPDDEAKTPHAAGSQPSTSPGSDQPQTITAPTPPVAWNSDPVDRTDLANEEDKPERPRTGDDPDRH